MSSKVITRCICDRCGCTAEIDGANAGRAPTGWSDVSIQYHDQTDQHGRGARYSPLLCCACTMGVYEAARRRDGAR